MALLIAIVILGLVFDYTNGFHDTANAIATVVSTGVMPVRYAIVMAACLNFAGALLGTSVATTIAKGIAAGAARSMTARPPRPSCTRAVIWSTRRHPSQSARAVSTPRSQPWPGRNWLCRA